MRDRIRRKHDSIRSEIERLFVHLEGAHKLVAAIFYGGGLRLLKGLPSAHPGLAIHTQPDPRAQRQGGEDRVTLLPPDQMAEARQLHAEDPAAGLGELYLPYVLERKYPNAAR